MSDEADFDDEAPPEPLTLKQRRFVDSFMGEGNGNATKACRQAGFAGDENTLASHASRLLRNPRVRAAIEARINGDHLVAGRIERTRWLTKVMRGEEKEPRVIGRDGQGQPIVKDCAPPMRERLAAQDALAKLSGDLVAKHQVSGPGGGPIEIMDMSKLSIAELLELAKLDRGEQ